MVSYYASPQFHVHRQSVLILIVVEDGLVRLVPFFNGKEHLECLNPYCSGRWSRTQSWQHVRYLRAIVLILIVVEDGLVLVSFLTSMVKNIWS